MADAPDGAIPVAHVMPAVVWTREMLTGAADQLKAKDPGKRAAHLSYLWQYLESSMPQ